MDRLSSEGVHFNNAFVVYSICSPSRATMLTGQYPHIHQVTDNHTDFPASATTYATLLRDEGYATGYFGKWHMGNQKARPGFDTAVTFKGQGTYFNTEFFDEVGDLHLALCLVELAALRASSVRIVCGRHDWVLNGVLESVRVQTTMAAPGGMVTVKDLLRGKTLHLACLEERVTLNSIDS